MTATKNITKIRRGDILWIQFPFSDGSSAKERPALVLSGKKVSDTGDLIMVQITSKVKDDGFSLPISNNDFKFDPLPIKSYVRIHKIFVLDASLVKKKISEVTPAYRKKIANAVKSLF